MDRKSRGEVDWVAFMKLHLMALLAAGLASQWSAWSAETVSLSALDLSKITTGWGKAEQDKSCTGKPLRIGEQSFATGVGTHAQSECWILLDGQAERFTAKVGVDRDTDDGRASLEFIIFGNDRELWRSGVCRAKEAPRACDVPLAGVTNLLLLVTDADDGQGWDHADWAEARLAYTGAVPKIVAPPAQPKEEAVILTPLAPAQPRLNGPKVYGGRPGAPFLYRIPATGERPMTFAAEGLPEGLSLNPATGIIAGKVPPVGVYRVLLKARNDRGEATREFRLIAGSKLALTPPMGWNSWYIHYHRVSDKVMRQAADQMIATGMADYGYQYVNIDDCWMMKPGSNDPELNGAPRDAAGRLVGNKRFPNMPAMTDYIHGKGLKAGIYISPGPTTCAGYEGSYTHEALDARTFADWGFDFLKYDWCSYGGKAGGNGLEQLKQPYEVMWKELQKLDRDVVFNLCQYGMGDVWKWGGTVGHCWRTTGDLGLESGGALPGSYRIGLSNARHWEFARPGEWNDPDYILIGSVGDARVGGEGTPTSLTPSEQYGYMSMWCLMASPLIFSGDMAKLDPFTLNVLCNPEVIEVDQDPLGQQARILKETHTELHLIKDMEDGSKVIGLFNFGRSETTLKATWEELGLKGKQRARDLWRQKDTGVFENSFEASTPRHGATLVRFWPTP